MAVVRLLMVVTGKIFKAYDVEISGAILKGVRRTIDAKDGND